MVYVRRTQRRNDSTTSGRKQNRTRRGATYGFSAWIEEPDKRRNPATSDYKIILTRRLRVDMMGLLFKERKKKKSLFCVLVFIPHIDSIHGRQWHKKRRIQTKIDEKVIFKKSVLFLKSCFPLHWWGPLKSCCCGTKHFSHVMTRMSDLRLFSDSSMDVQGDYDPCDASGFIRINAVRLASPPPAQGSLPTQLF